jgi:hypothetical protein
VAGTTAMPAAREERAPKAAPFPSLHPRKQSGSGLGGQRACRTGPAEAVNRSSNASTPHVLLALRSKTCAMLR